MRMLITIALVATAGCVSTPAQDDFACYVYQPPPDDVRATSCVDTRGWARGDVLRWCSSFDATVDVGPCYTIGTVARCTFATDWGLATETYYLPWTTQDALALCESVGGYFEVGP